MLGPPCACTFSLGKKRPVGSASASAFSSRIDYARTTHSPERCTGTWSEYYILDDSATWHREFVYLSMLEFVWILNVV